MPLSFTALAVPNIRIELKAKLRMGRIIFRGPHIEQIAFYKCFEVAVIVACADPHAGPDLGYTTWRAKPCMIKLCVRDTDAV